MAFSGCTLIHGDYPGTSTLRSGYLSVETHDERPGLARLVLSDAPPATAPVRGAATRIRYIARFNDIEAALMHTHEFLKRRLIDPDSHLYRVPMEQAIAATESVALRHRDVYLDGELSEHSRREIGRFKTLFLDRQRRKDRLFDTLGYIGLGLLLFNLLFLSLT